MTWLDTIKGGTPEDQFAVVAGRWLNKRHLGPYDQFEAERIARELRGTVIRLTLPNDGEENDDEQPVGAFGRTLNSGAYGQGSGFGRGGAFG